MHRDHFNLVTRSDRNCLATRNGRRKSEASLLLHFMNNTLPGKVAEDNHQLLSVQLDALLTHHMPMGPVFTNTSLDLIPRESRILSVTNSAATF